MTRWDCRFHRVSHTSPCTRTPPRSQDVRGRTTNCDSIREYHMCHCQYVHYIGVPRTPIQAPIHAGGKETRSLRNTDPLRNTVFTRDIITVVDRLSHRSFECG